MSAGLLVRGRLLAILSPAVRPRLELALPGPPSSPPDPRPIPTPMGPLPLVLKPPPGRPSPISFSPSLKASGASSQTLFPF